jgi:hypothetical protein
MAEMAKEISFALLASMIFGALKGIVSWVKSIFARSAKTESPYRNRVARVRRAYPMQALAMFGIATVGMLAVFGSRVAATSSTFNFSFLWDLVDSFDEGIPHIDTFITDGLPLAVKIIILVGIAGAFGLAIEWAHKRIK